MWGKKLYASHSHSRDDNPWHCASTWLLKGAYWENNRVWSRTPTHVIQKHWRIWLLPTCWLFLHGVIRFKKKVEKIGVWTAAGVVAWWINHLHTWQVSSKKTIRFFSQAVMGHGVILLRLPSCRLRSSWSGSERPQLLQGQWSSADAARGTIN